MWPYGTMTLQDRIEVEDKLAQSGDEQERAFLAQWLAIDEEARNCAGVGVVLPAAGEPSWLSLGVGVEQADRAIAAVVGERVVTSSRSTTPTEHGDARSPGITTGAFSFPRPRGLTGPASAFIDSFVEHSS